MILGPWTFRWYPDGDDPGVGTVKISNESYVFAEFQTTLLEWRAFVRSL